MSEKVIGYIHTIDGRPAAFDGEQICFVDQYPRGRFHARLVSSLVEIRREQRASEHNRIAEGFSPTPYGYVKVTAAKGDR